MNFKRLQNLSLYVVFSAINGAIPFFLLPVLTNYLSPSSYGTVAIFQTSMAACIPIVSLSLGFKIDKDFFNVSKASLAVNVFNILAVMLTIIIALTLLIYCLAVPLEIELVRLPNVWMMSLPLLSGISCVPAFILILVRNQERIGEYGFWQIGFTLLNLGLSLLFVVCYSFDWQGRALGITLANIIVGTLAMFRMYQTGYLVFVFNLSSYIEILKFGLPLLFNGVSIFLMYQANIFLLDYFLDKSDVGIYSVAFAFAAITGLIKDGVVKTFNPWLYRVLSEVSTKQLRLDIVKKILLIGLVLISLPFIVEKISSLLIVYMVNPDYYSAQNLVLILSMSVAVNGIYNVVVPFYIVRSNTKLLSLTSVITAIFSLFINYFLIKEYGKEGAAWSLLLIVSIQLLLVLCCLPLNKIYPKN